jgi:2-hydroxy-6-oxonona-2,4-dienedioate hydrolase
VKAVALGVLVVAATAAILLAFTFRSDMRAAYQRIQGVSTVVDSPFGSIEFVQGGEGPPLLVVHGSGGGFDQGELIAGAVLEGSFRFIAPSRFGYLGSAAPPQAGFDDQAHAYAWLLDHLGIESVAVVALSQGGPSALFFALLYPERVSSLTLLSAGVTPVGTEGQAGADTKGRMWVRLFRGDFPYWVASRLFRGQVMGLMGASPDVVAGLAPGQRRWIGEVIDFMNPTSPRYAGVVLDNRNPLPGARIAGIMAPTLVVHAEDDTLQLFENGLFAAEAIPGARFLRFERGGHFVVILEQERVRAAVGDHIRAHLPGGRPDR